MFKRLCIFLAFLLVRTSDSAKILAIFPSYGYSQFFVGQLLLKNLAKNGHEITLLSAHKMKQTVENIESITAPGIINQEATADLEYFDLHNWDILKSIRVTHEVYGVAECENLLSDPKVKSLINSNRTFDLVIQEFWSGESLMAFAHHFNAPLVIFSTTGASDWSNYLVSNPSPFSYVPYSLSEFTTSMTFLERAKNLFLHCYFLYLKHFVLLPKHQELITTHFPRPPGIEDVIYNVSLILLNSHPSVTPPYPLASNMIEIGGFHITEEPMPNDLQEFLDDASQGAIYFCMGSNVQSKSMGRKRIGAILKVFSGLREKVLWKFEAEELPNKPANVEIRKWLPQRAVLGHRNVKLFISHCGLIGMIESVYFGKPIVCIPVFLDQAMNAALAKNNGIATVLDFKNLNEDSFRSAIFEILDDKRYMENVQSRSQYFTGQYVKPLDLATHWVELVSKHRGAPHLRNPGLSLRWYQYYFLDLAAVVLLATFLVSYFLKKLVKMLKGAPIKLKRS